MSVYAVKNGEWDFSIVITDENKVIQQRIETSLREFKGNYFFDENNGINYILFLQNPLDTIVQSMIIQQIKDTINKIQGIIESSVSLEIDSTKNVAIINIIYKTINTEQQYNDIIIL